MVGLFHFQMAFSWLINGGDPNHLLTGMILQVIPEKPSLSRSFGTTSGPRHVKTQVMQWPDGRRYVGQYQEEPPWPKPFRREKHVHLDVPGS